ncbi:MAG: DUF2088 domain-containing protein [Deltaproteobacteria bacterium]|nr:MAG: DUF2088 domain-containing protein [Deltaproteobacteria bacterium]
MTAVDLPYGARPLRARVPDRATIVAPEPARGVASLPACFDRALAHPVGAPPLSAADRVTVVVSDPTRAEPRAHLVAAVLRRLGDPAHVTLAIATGTHGPCDVAALGLPGGLLARCRVVNHDARDDGQLVQVGTTRRGTPLVVHRCLVEADLVVATGVIRPHYFAGFGAGAKALFPGLGQDRAVRVNHEWKRNPAAVAGRVDGNPCREDLEEIVDALACEVHVLNAIAGPGGAIIGAVAGEPRAALRAGAQACAEAFRARAPDADAIVVSDALPLTGSVYQASKLVAAVAPKLRPGGRIVVAAQCPHGTGPVDVVNRGIYEIGLRPRLPDRHELLLVSDLPGAEVARTYFVPAASVEAALDGVRGDVLVVTRGGDVLW